VVPSTILCSRSAFVESQQRSFNHDSSGEVDTEVRIWRRWRRIGESSGRRAGGGRGETKAVGRQARRGGSRARESGALISSTMFIRGMTEMDSGELWREEGTVQKRRGRSSGEEVQ